MLWNTLGLGYGTVHQIKTWVQTGMSGLSCFLLGRHFDFSLNGLYLENGSTEDIGIVHDAE